MPIGISLAVIAAILAIAIGASLRRTPDTVPEPVASVAGSSTPN